MIPAAFDYHAPTTLAEATALLARLGDDAKLLSGGQSLIPLHFCCAGCTATFDRDPRPYLAALER